MSLDAARTMVKELDTCVKIFGGGVEDAKEGAAARAYRLVTNLLNELEGSGATAADDRFDRRIYLLRVDIDRVAGSFPLSSEAVGRIVDRVSEAVYNGVYDRLVSQAEKILERVHNAAPRSKKVAGVTLNNMSGVPGALNEIAGVMSKVGVLVRRVGWGKLLYGELNIVRGEQMSAYADPDHAGAVYVASEDVIYVVFPPADDRALVYRVVHELGHRLWYKFLLVRQQDLWFRSWRAVSVAGGRYVSRYAKKGGYKEDFSECFLALCRGRIPTSHKDRLREVGVI